MGISVPMENATDAERMKAQFAAEGIGLLATMSLGDGVDWFWLDSQDAYKTLIASGVGSSFDRIAPTRTYPGT